jgi:hypothetical protein
MKLKFLYLAVLIFGLIGFTAFFSGDGDDVRSTFGDRIFTESDFAPGDSCAVQNPERHDDFTHENGYRQSVAGADSTRFVIKMRPQSTPWTYTKICVGWTASGSATLSYSIVVYDTLGAGGAPGSLLMLIPGQSIAGIPGFPSMIWNSSTVSIPVTGAVYIGVRWNATATSNVFCSADESPATTLWAGYKAVGSPPTWTTIQSQFAGYRCMCIRAEGQGGGGQLNQPDEWCNIPPGIPGSGAIWGHASVAFGDTLYVQGDGAATATTMFRKYSISGNTWTTGTPMPGPKAGGDLVACGGKIYYVGGGSSVTVGDAPQYVYNPATGTWTTIAPIPVPRTGMVGESYQDSLIYVISGGWTTYSTQVDVYRVGSNTWTTATAMPGGTGRRSFAGGLWGNKIFVCAGYSASYRNDLQIGTINPANPLSITWAAGPSIAQNSSRPGGTAIADRFYIVIGEVVTPVGAASDSMGIFNINTNTWSYVDGKPTRTSNLWGVVSGSFVNCSGRMGVKIWVPGGSLTNTNRPLDVFADTCLINCTVVTGVAQNNNNRIPETYVLKQNYPNPFNPSTKISYLLPKASDVKLVVYDLLGREVITLVNEFRTAGTHTVEFNASNLASGVYLYRIEAGDFKDT